MQAPRIVPLLPPCKHYVEVFGGGGSILFARRPAKIETFNDLDGTVVEFFRVLADPKLFKRFRRRVESLPYSRELYEEYRENLEAQKDIVERTARWFVVVQQSFGGQGAHEKTGWAYAITNSARGMSKRAAAWIQVLKRLPQVHARLQRVQIEQDDFRKILKRYDTPSTLFYLDPPYIPETRKAGQYRVEMTADDHRELVEILLQLEGAAALSGYRHKLYSPLDRSPEWKRHEWEYANFADRTKGKKRSKRTECLWVKQGGMKRGFGL